MSASDAILAEVVRHGLQATAQCTWTGASSPSTMPEIC